MSRKRSKEQTSQEIEKTEASSSEVEETVQPSEAIVQTSKRKRRSKSSTQDTSAEKVEVLNEQMTPEPESKPKPKPTPAEEIKIDPASKNLKDIDIRDVERYNPSLNEGLTEKQVQARKAEGLTNQIKTHTGKSVSQIVISNVFTFFNMLLLLIAIALWIFGKITSTYFLLVAVINTLIGTIQEIKAKNTIDKLKLVTAMNLNVIRDGKKTTIPVEEIVLDDIYTLATGDQIPTDSIVKQGSIEVNESLLTGESLPIKKNTGDFIYAGSFVVSGSAIVQANKVGDYNYASGIQAKAKEYSKPKSELVRSLNLIIRVIAIIIIPLGIATFVTQWFNVSNSSSFAGLSNWLIASETMSRTAGSVVGMIPSGMYLLTSVALAVGVINLSKKKTLVQDLYCIEMLARVNVLCLDKTGTLTDGTMKVDEVLVIDSSVDLNKTMGSYLNAFRESNQTSIALSKRYPLKNDYKVKTSIPFSSARKYSAVTFYEYGTYVLGAPEFIYKNKERVIANYITKKQSKGYRVIMMCKTEKDIVDGEIKGRLSPVAVFTLEDHIRPEAPSTIKWFCENDVQIKIISGDNPLTASEIAKKCGVPDAEKCISLEGLSTREVQEIVDQYTVFGRVSPEQKAAIIKELKNRQYTVGMTGDGVNDILAMKNADCSIAMATGSAAARNTAHLVLLDSNFASMPAVVQEGRRVVNNIQRSSSLYLMKTMFTIVFTIIVLLTFIGGSGINYPFETNNILITEIVAIGIPSLVLSIQKNNQLITGHFLRNTFARAIPAALCLILCIGLNYIFRNIDSGGFLELSTNSDYANNSFTTFCSITMAVVALAMVFNCCQPLNRFRAILFAVVILLFFLLVFAMPFIPAFSANPYTDSSLYWNFSVQISGIDFRYLTKPMWFILIIYASLSTVLLNFFLRVFKWMQNSSMPIPFLHRKKKDAEKVVSPEELDINDQDNDSNLQEVG